jgi:hypothetical protein
MNEKMAGDVLLLLARRKVFLRGSKTFTLLLSLGMGGEGGGGEGGGGRGLGGGRLGV